MASFIGRLLASLKSRNQLGRRAARNRQLRIEPMEKRRLLAGNIASISGNVFTDLTEDGTNTGDPAIVGTNVFLYRDGGNTVIDSAGGLASGDDTLIGTAVTDSSGNYSFINLTAGTYFVEQAPASGLLQRASETFKTVVISESEAAGVAVSNVDTFTTAQSTLTADSGSPTDSSTAATGANEAIGDERDLLVNYVSGGSNVTAQVTSGLLDVQAGLGTSGNVVLVYDGTDNDASTLTHNLLLQDLTAGGASAFHFLAGAQGTVTLTVDVFSGSGNFSTATIAIPDTGGSGAIENVNIAYSSFTAGGGSNADFTAVTAIRIQINLTSGANAQFDFSQLVSPFVSTQNFANLNPMSVGNQVFRDANANGVLDVGESGISGVQVELYNDTNGNGSYDSGVDTSAASAQITDGSGNFLFSDLLPGDYILLVPISQFVSGQPLFGFVTSPNDPAPDPDTTVVNGDDNGSLIATVGVATSAVTLAAGSESVVDGDTDNNTDLTVDFGFVPEIDLEVTKTSNVATVTAGNQLTYTVTVSNIGNGTANNVLVVDDLPDLTPTALTIISATSTGGGVVNLTGNASGEIEVAFASLAGGQSETITIVVEVPAAEVATTMSNTVTVSGGDGLEASTSNNTFLYDVSINRQALLTLTKTDTPDPAVVGSALSYQILVTNTGPSTATNVVVSDTLPAGLTFDSVGTTAGTASEASGVITANIPSLAPGASATITVNTTIESTFSGTTIPNSATADADEATLVTANASTSVNPQVDLQITKTDNADPVNRGEQMVYTLTVTNSGPSAATNVEVIDTLPADVSFVSATGGTVTPPTGGSSNVTVAIGTLAAGASTDVTITVDVQQNASASFTNNATVRSTESTGGFDVNTLNNTTTEDTAAQSTVDLAVTKADSADPAVPGESLTYTLTVSNTGPSDAPAVILVDNIPDGIQITSATSSIGTVTTPASAQDTTAANADDLTVNIGTLASGATATITVVATVLPETRGSLSNVAMVSSTDTTLLEPNTGNNSVTETTVLNAEVDLRVSKTDSTDPVIAGNSLTYTIIVTNDGPSTATNVTLSDSLPSGVSFTSATASQGTAGESGGTVTGQLGSLAPGASATLTIVVGVDPGTRGTLNNTVTATATETDAEPTDNSTTQMTTVNSAVDLSITKVDSADPVAATGTLTYTIVVTNNGPSTATDVIVTDSLPAELEFVSATTTAGTVGNVGNQVTANVGTLAPGATATITLNTTVVSTATGSISNTAAVDSTETDTVTTNNSVTQTTDIAVPGSLSGSVYIDSDGDGVRDADETGIAGVTISLSGTNLLGSVISAQQTTDASGNYTFSELLPGTYTLTETQPRGFLDGLATVGTGATGAVATSNQIDTITLASGAAAAAFNFGESQAISMRLCLASVLFPVTT